MREMVGNGAQKVTISVGTDELYAEGSSLARFPVYVDFGGQGYNELTLRAECKALKAPEDAKGKADVCFRVTFSPDLPTEKKDTVVNIMHEILVDRRGICTGVTY